MLESLGAFAGGLAQGIRTGQDMKLRQQDANRLRKTDEREAELQRTRIDKAEFNREKRERLRAANDEIAIPWQQDKQKPSTPSYPTYRPRLKFLFPAPQATGGFVHVNPVSFPSRKTLHVAAVPPRYENDTPVFCVEP